MISVVIPVLNAKKSLQELVRDLLTLREEKSYAMEIILVDDVSQDDSRTIARELAEHEEGVRFFANAHRLGQQETLLRGLSHARGDILVTMDDDARHDPGDIPGLIRCLENGYDLVYGIPRQGTAQTRVRRMGSMARDRLFWHLYPFLGNNRVGSFRAFTKELHREATRCPVRFSYLSCLHLNMEPKVANLMLSEGASKRTTSNYRFSTLFWLLIRIYWCYGPGASWNRRRNKICES